MSSSPLGNSPARGELGGSPLRGEAPADPPPGEPLTAIQDLRRRIPEDTLEWSFSRSGGPGGQNVNKVSTRATLTLDLAACEGLTEDEKQLIRTRLRRRLTRQDQLRVVSAVYRTQSANRREALRRLYALLARALEQRRPRRPTATPRSAHRRRLADKALSGERKQMRRRVSPDEPH